MKMDEFLVPILGEGKWTRDRFCSFLGIGAGTATLLGAGISGAGSAAGGKKGASGARDAAAIQAQAAMAALQLQQQIRQQNVDIMQPFVDYGKGGINDLTSALAKYTQPIDTTLPTFDEKFTFQPTMADLEKTPGYQFQRQQALWAAMGPLAAQGRGGWAPIGTSESVASGLAASNWQNVFNAEQGAYQTREQAFLANTQNLLAGRTMDLQQRQQILSDLASRVQTGMAAGGALAGANLQSGQLGGQYLTQAGAAQASGVVGATNALTAGLTGATSAIGGGLNSYANQLLLGQALGSGGNFANSGRIDAGSAYLQNPSFMVGETP